MWPTRVELIQRLKGMAVRKDVTGYYAARMLCDVLPASSLYDDITSAVAAQELAEARHLDQGKFLDPPTR